MGRVRSDTEDPWYVRTFGELYPLIYRHRNDAQARRQVEQMMGLLALEPGSRVLDVCCGAGRHLDAMRRHRLDAWGVDLSEPLLRQAAERRGLAGRLVRADMRALPFEAGFDAAVNLFTSFGYFISDAANAAALRQMVRTLRPGGRLLMDLVHRALLEREFSPYNEEPIEGFHVEHHRRLVGDRVQKQTLVTDPQGERSRFDESVRLYRPAEMQEMAREAGLESGRLVGAFDGRRFDENAPRMIVIGERGS
jgi:ubiquinone/menaquinone biosynthesis C-methylase UbiE